MPPPTDITCRNVQSGKGDTVYRDWRCRECAKLLGRCCGESILIQFARGHRYRASRPLTAVCRRCGTLNEA